MVRGKRKDGGGARRCPDAGGARRGDAKVAGGGDLRVARSCAREKREARVFAHNEKAHVPLAVPLPPFNR
jgi:hypothetical protein